MCGIVAVVYRRTDRSAPDGQNLVNRMESGRERLSHIIKKGPLAGQIEAVADVLRSIDAELRGGAGLRRLSLTNLT